MSVLIKKMEMPKGCWACPFAVGKHYECLFTKKSYNWGLTTRPSDCPLIEIQSPHGRLIDADAMCNDLATVDIQYAQMIDWCISVTEAQPTIIEAEKKRARHEDP
jgi:hypothetical protein